jgi:lauroyl/myristoyl acyltransferase
MPVAYIRLAIKAGIPVTVAAITRLPSGNYLIDSSDPIPMKPYPDLKTEMEKNAEAVLDMAERFILRAPQQWLMFYPVWPNAESEMP